MVFEKQREPIGRQVDCKLKFVVGIFQVVKIENADIFLEKGFTTGCTVDSETHYFHHV